MTDRIGPLPAFDPEIAPLMDNWPDYSVRDSTIRELVAQRSLVLDRADIERGGAFAVRTQTVPSENGRTVPLTIITPRRTSVRGAIYWLHSGGMVSGGSLGIDLPPVLDIAEAQSLVVVAAEYGLGPELPAPAGHQDSFAGFTWTAANAAELGFPRDALFLHGLSGGANMAAATALLARDAGIDYAGVVLDGPMLDDRTSTVSYQQNDAHPAKLPEVLRHMWSGVLEGASPTVIADHPYVAPGRLLDSDLSGMPPMYIACGANDPFRSESVAYAEAIWRSGGVADLHQWAGTLHGSDTMVPGAHVSQESAATRQGWYDRMFARIRATVETASSQ